MDEIPKHLKRSVSRLSQAGEVPLLVVSALLDRYSTEHMRAMARIGVEQEKASSFIVATENNLHFVRTGILWDRVQTVPISSITGVEYVDEFHTNTMKLKIRGAAEKVIFYEELEGVKFYRFMMSRLGHS